MSQENLLSSIKSIVATGASIAQTRLELLSVDVQIDYLRAILFILWLSDAGAAHCDL